MEKYIKGNYSRTIFSGSNGFTIGLFKIKETNVDSLEDYKTVIFKGYFDNLNTNDLYIFYGVDVEHERYGLQFDVSSYEKVKPTDRLGVITFLSSELFPGIGEVLAKKIVDILGNNALDLILDNPSILDSIPKLSKKKKSVIINTLSNYNESHNVILKLTEYGFNMKDSLMLYNKYQAYILDIINFDIYKLIYDNLSFNKIDMLALNNGYDKYNPSRIKALIVHAIKDLVFIKGDTYLYKAEIKEYIKSYLDDFDIDDYLDELNNNDIYIDGDRYYLMDMYMDEVYIANRLKKLSKEEKVKNLDKEIDEYQKKKGIIYSDSQRYAIKSALTKNLVIITGGPGVGKTTIVKAIVDLYEKLNKKEKNSIALLAPTGRASKRMSISSSRPAKTIHSFLKWNKEDNTFSVNELNKDLHDMVIVDEVSMVDEFLFASLLKGIKDDVKLILVGDYNQLPSVGPGNILKDLIDSDSIDTIYLDKLYRQSDTSYIPYLAHEIKEGSLESDFKKMRDDYIFLPCNSSSINNNIKAILTKAIEKDKNIFDIQIMAPMYKGEVGIDNLNNILQEIVNPKSEDKKEIKYGNVIFREGDKVLQLQNIPDENVYNGDIGYITKIDTSKNILNVSFDGNVVKYQTKDLINITLGYIISIHKSQGSEFDTVILPMSLSYRKMLYKNLIYTAITRAKRKLIILGDVNAFLYGVSNDYEISRKTYLKERIK